MHHILAKNILTLVKIYDKMNVESFGKDSPLRQVIQKQI